MRGVLPAPSDILSSSCPSHPLDAGSRFPWRVTEAIPCGLCSTYPSLSTQLKPCEIRTASARHRHQLGHPVIWRLVSPVEVRCTIREIHVTVARLRDSGCLAEIQKLFLFSTSPLKVNGCIVRFRYPGRRMTFSRALSLNHNEKKWSFDWAQISRHVILVLGPHWRLHNARFNARIQPICSAPLSG